MQAPLSSPVLDAFATSLGQHARLLTLTGPCASLAVERMAGHEAVNDLYRFDVDALSPSTDLDLSRFIGEELTVALLQPDGTWRAWHGLCTSCAWLGADGGAARYRLRLEPALSLLALRRDGWIFQDRTTSAIPTSKIGQDYVKLFGIGAPDRRRHYQFSARL